MHEDLVGPPALLDLDSPDVDSPLPTTVDLFKHAHHLIKNDNYTSSNVYNRVAEDVIKLYTNRSQPSASRPVISR